MARRSGISRALFSVLALGSVLFCAFLGYSQTPTTIADEPVERVTVRLRLAPDSAPLDTYLALDLGVGIPLVLFEGPGLPATLRMSVMPDERAGDYPLPPGREAVFEFRASGLDAGDFGRKFVLFRDLRVSDLGRVGLYAPESAAWTIDTVELSVNGRVFWSLEEGGITPAHLYAAARDQLDRLGDELETKEQELRDLRALQEAGLATETDVERLLQLDQELGELALQRTWLEGVLAGRYPVFSRPAFFNPLRRGFPLTDLEAIIETVPEADAGTRHDVLLKLGGHTLHCTPMGDELEAPGSYRLPMDLLAVPLVASDLRRIEVVVLADPRDTPGDPDLLRLRRVAVAVDGRLFYDSEASTVDRLSLQAVRLGPPVWRAAPDDVRVWGPTTEWLPVWTGGAGQGLQVSLPEGGAPDTPPDGGGIGGGAPPGIGLPPVGGPFPGWDPSWGPPPIWIDIVVGWLLPPVPLPPWLWPPLLGPAFQVDDVRIVSGWKQTHNYRVDWDVAGNAGAIDHFVVELLPFDPAANPPITGPSLASVVLPSAARSFVFPTPMPAAPPPYVLAMVTAVPSVPWLAVNSEISPARPVLPIGSTVAVQPGVLSPYFYSTGGPFSPAPVSAGPPPGFPPRAAWTFGVDVAHSGWRLGPAFPGVNVAVRPGPSDTNTLLFFQSNGVNGPKNLVFELGFIGEILTADTVQVEVRAWGPGGPWGPVNATLSVNPVLAPPPLVRVTLPINVAGPGLVTYRIKIQGGNANPLQPVGLFGVRLEP